MKKIILLIIIATFFGCCNEDENTTSVNNFIDKYNVFYMMYPQGILSNSGTDNNVKIEYDSYNRISKRIGDLRPIDQATGYNFIFTNEFYDQLTYTSNEIFIEKKSSNAAVIVAKFERKLILDSQNRIVKKINFHELGFPATDTTYYTYDSNGRLKESKNSVFHQVETANFYYNQANNLDSIVTKKVHYENPLYKIVEHFSEYDNAENPLKNLVIFEETFYRALSKNNFKKYERKEYDGAYELMGTSYRTWNLQYDSNGKVKFDQF